MGENERRTVRHAEALPMHAGIEGSKDGRGNRRANQKREKRQCPQWGLNRKKVRGDEEGKAGEGDYGGGEDWRLSIVPLLPVHTSHGREFGKK